MHSGRLWPFLIFIEGLFLLDFLPSTARMTIIVVKQLEKAGSFMLVLTIFLFGFALAGTQLFGVIMPEYATPFRSISTVFAGITIQGLPAAAEDASPLSAHLFHFVVIFMGVILMLNLLIAVMTEGYEDVRNRANETGHCSSPDPRSETFEVARGEVEHQAKGATRAPLRRW